MALAWPFNTGFTVMVTNFRKNPRGSGYFCVEMTCNDPYLLHNYTADAKFYKLANKTSVKRT